MKARRKASWIASFAIILAGLLLIAPGLQAADNEDSVQVSKLLSEAKTQALRLSEDAAQMESFTWTGVPMGWQSHTDAIMDIKDDVNAMGRQIVKLEEARTTASSWQRVAIDRITPLLKELASNTTGAIEILNNNQKALNNDEYQDYLEGNADAAARLASLVSDFVDYGKTKQRLERLKDRLEVGPKSD